ncbi:9830_t:CDS:2 [Entrophospora sp. SA101]|nr:9830_t:CDS:2 [Entrophospora sp. SA101]CAJ0829951.1 3583_t:CDS:2 [Entrophospora sp. SA101]
MKNNLTRTNNEVDNNLLLPQPVAKRQRKQENAVDQIATTTSNFLDVIDLTEEQKKIVLQRMQEVKARYQTFIQAILFASDLVEEEARLALSICNYNEQEVLNKLFGKNGNQFRKLLKPASQDIDSNKHIDQCAELQINDHNEDENDNNNNNIDYDDVDVDNERDFDSSDFDSIDENISSLNYIKFPLDLPSTTTTVISIGTYHKSPTWWSNPGSLYHHPIPINYKATRIEWNKIFEMTIEEDQNTGNPLFRVTAKGTNSTFIGSTPTKPWTSVCVSYKKSRATRISGPLYFGFSDVLLQKLLTKMVQDSDPEEYYYRFVGEGEILCTNKEWNEDERNLFDSGTIFPFGLVSQNILNRAGFQCQYEYNRLVTTGQINEIDNCPVKPLRVNYDKFVKQLVSNGQMKRARKYSGKSDKDLINILNKYGRVGNNSIDLIDNKFGINFNPLNPVLHLKDAITLEEMKEPTISPDGYVCDYQTWIKILRDPDAKDTCP